MTKPASQRILRDRAQWCLTPQKLGQEAQVREKAGDRIDRVIGTAQILLIGQCARPQHRRRGRRRNDRHWLLLRPSDWRGGVGEKQARLLHRVIRWFVCVGHSGPRIDLSRKNWTSAPQYGPFGRCLQANGTVCRIYWPLRRLAASTWPDRLAVTYVRYPLHARCHH